MLEPSRDIPGAVPSPERKPGPPNIFGDAALPPVPLPASSKTGQVPQTMPPAAVHRMDDQPVPGSAGIPADAGAQSVFDLPRPAGNWLTGHLKELRRDMLGLFSRCAQEYGDVVPLRFGPIRVAMINSPELIEELLVHQNKNFKKDYTMQMMRPVIGNGLLLSEGEEWLKQRRLIQPSFSKAQVEAYGRETLKQADTMLSGWREGDKRNLYSELNSLTLTLMAKTMMNLELTGYADKLDKTLVDLMRYYDKKLLSAIPVPDWLPTPNNLRLKGMIRDICTVIDTAIEERRPNAAEGTDMLSALIRAQEKGAPLSDKLIRDEMLTAILAGYESSSNGLAWTTYLLSKHPETEARVKAEIDRVLDSGPLSVSHARELKYTEACLLESMRVFPPVYVINREAVKDCVVGKYKIPAGTQTIISQWVMHRNPRYFDKPEEFRPERWLDGSTENLPKCVYFPFGVGPRGCIGGSFGMLEMTLVLAAMNRRFSFELPPGYEAVPWPSITLRPKNGLPVTIRER